jgi:peptidoglycan-N-acetylglucosamine deacetylase
MKRVPLPAWVLLIALVAFVIIWTLAPQESFSGRASPPFTSSPRPRPAGLHNALLELVPETARREAEVETDFIASRPWEVAFTFDDGPHHLFTPRLLDLLEEKGVRATFFVNGRWLDPPYEHAQANRKILLRAHLEGHTIGNHTYNHVNLTSLPEEMQRWEIAANERAIASITGFKPTLFRLPYAATSRKIRSLLKEQGYAEARWNASAPDTEVKDAQVIAQTVMLWIHHHQGGIVMLHDRYRWSIQAMTIILEELGQENCRRLARDESIFRVVPLDSFLLPPAQSHPLKTLAEAGGKAEGLQERIHRPCTGR